jgi:hypothetical protein
MKPDAIIEIRLKTTSEGGPWGAIKMENRDW